MHSPEHERRDIIRYWKLESGSDEEPVYAEKVHTEVLSNDRRYDVWDVHGTEERWWVIRPSLGIVGVMALYWQDESPTIDAALNYHIGSEERWRAEYKRSQTPEEQRDRLATSFRRVEQANDALKRADEAEEFQAVGMRCRECLLAFIREVATEAMVPEEQEPPKLGDFIRWSELVASTITAGASSKRVRAYLKTVAERTWELVGWLTHSSNATLFDGEITVEATRHLLVVYSYALARYERGQPDRCPVCNSYRLAFDYHPELGLYHPDFRRPNVAYVTRCASCGCEDEPQPVTSPW